MLLLFALSLFRWYSLLISTLFLFHKYLFGLFVSHSDWILLILIVLHASTHMYTFNLHTFEIFSFYWLLRLAVALHINIFLYSFAQFSQTHSICYKFSVVHTIFHCILHIYMYSVVEHFIVSFLYVIWRYNSSLWISTYIYSDKERIYK